MLLRLEEEDVGVRLVYSSLALKWPSVILEQRPESAEDAIHSVCNIV